jgi:cell division initiation protein
MPDRLRALDIKKKEFPQKMRGPDPEEVRAFLDQAAEEVELLTIEKKDAEDRLAASTERLDYYISLERTIEKTLAAAQQSVVKMEEQARKEAELILRDAELERSRKVSDARMELDRIESQLLRARGEYQSMIARMRSTMAGFESFMQTLEQETKPA